MDNKHSPNQHVIFGTGPLGQSVMRELVARGAAVRMLNRSGSVPFALPSGVSIGAADALAQDGAIAATRGASHIYNCTNAPYNQWPTVLPPQFDNILAAASAAGAKLVIGDNVYAYGDTNGQPMREDTPERATSVRGRVRAAMAAKMLAAHQAGRAQVAIVRGSDYIGPAVTDAVLGNGAIRPAVVGKAAQLVGNPDLPHSTTYIGDMGRAIALVALRDDAYGQVWHAPNAPGMTQRNMMDLIFAAAGHKPRYSVANRLMINALSIFVPKLRGFGEMMYQFEKPFIVDSGKIERAFSITATPPRDVAQATVAWYTQN
jgi:nucleoside-diphosphate-sugar epimerase